MDIDIGDGSGEISSEDEAVEPSEYQLRKEYQKTRDYTVIKCGLLKLCDDPRMRDLLEVCVQRCSIIAVEASMLASIHVLRVLDPDPRKKSWEGEILNVASARQQVFQSMYLQYCQFEHRATEQ